VSVAAATSTPVPDAVDRFLATAPKVELHLHLVGSASPASLAEAVTEGLTEGRRRAAALGVALALVYDIPGQMGEEGARATLAAALDHPPDGLVGFGLGGAEAGVERRDFGWAFDRARAAGLASLPHAGEGDGPASVWAAIDRLGAVRIGHGVRAVEDPALVAELAARASHWRCARRRTCAPGSCPRWPSTRSPPSATPGSSSPSTARPGGHHVFYVEVVAGATTST
jgi:adenosine deaminase